MSQPGKNPKMGHPGGHVEAIGDMPGEIINLWVDVYIYIHIYIYIYIPRYRAAVQDKTSGIRWPCVCVSP